MSTGKTPEERVAQGSISAVHCDDLGEEVPVGTCPLCGEREALEWRLGGAHFCAVCCERITRGWLRRPSPAGALLRATRDAVIAERQAGR